MSKGWFAVIIIMFAVFTQAACAGVIRIDPNTPEGRAALGISEPEKADARLLQKVTYTADKQCVSDILDDITNSTGVTLNAGYNENDWQVRDRKMNIHVKDLPLADLMGAIARVMNFRWKQEGVGDQRSYRLDMDRQSIIMAQVRKKQQAELGARRLANARQSLINTVDDISSLSVAQIRDLKQENPYAYALAESGTADALEMLFSDCPGVQQAFLSGSEFEINGSQLPTDAQDVLVRLVSGMRKMDVGFVYVKPDVKSIPDGLAGNSDKISLVINRTQAAPDGYVVGMCALFPNGSGKDSASLELLDPSTPMAELEGHYIIDRWENPPEDAKDIWHKYWQQRGNVWINYDQDLRNAGLDPVNPHADDPDLNKTAEIKIERKTYHASDFEELMVKHFGVNVVADAYNRANEVSFSAKPEMSLGDLLAKLEAFFCSNWWKHRNLVEVRARNWYDLREKQIPEEWIDAWREEFKTTNTLGLDSLSAIASLGFHKFFWNVECDEDLCWPGDQRSELSQLIARSDRRGILSFYANLTRRQRRYVFTEDGLDLLNIRPDKRPALEALVGIPTRSDSPLNPEAGIRKLRLVGNWEKHDKVCNFKFVIKADKGDGLESWRTYSFTSPRYIDPRKRNADAGGE